MFTAVTQCWRQHGGIYWLVIGIAAFSAVMLNDLGRLLGDVQVPGRPAFDASVFTAPHLPNRTENLQEAISVWSQAEADLRQAPPEYREADRGPSFFVHLHASIDFLLFTPAYCFLLRIFLKQLTDNPRFASVIAASALIFDEFENIATFVFVGNLSGTSATLQFLGWLTLGKWTALTAGSITGVLLWRSSRRAGVLQGATESPWRPLLALILLVTYFVALIALPAGGALEQLPDVVRFHLLRLDSSITPYLSVLALLLFSLTVSVSGWMCLTNTTRATPGPGSAGEVMTTSKVLWVCAAFSTFSVLISALSGHAGFMPAVVIFSIVGILWILARIVSYLRPGGLGAGAPPRGTPEHTAPAWIGGLGGAIIVALGLAIVRAAFPPWVVGLKNPEVPWFFTTTIGAVIAAFGGVLFQCVVIRQLRSTHGDQWFKYPPTLVVLALATFAALWLARDPSGAAYIGSLGSICIGLGALAILIGLLRWASRRYPPWWVTKTLGFASGTPWLVLFLVSWDVASIANTKGIYHDARVVQLPGKHRYADLTDAFNQWIITQKLIQQSCPNKAQGPLPMVFVATAGGGIRAAYWTTGVLDQLFGTQSDLCGPTGSLFAISGVSGGSVGAATWLAAVSSKQSPMKAADGLADDTALPAALAAMLLRDLPQPLIQGQWRDRAAVLEDGWIQSTSVFRAANPAVLTWSQLGEGLPWKPLLILNASSVNDGCRVLVTNAEALPAVGTGDCERLPTEVKSAGPVSSSLDPFSGLVDRGRADSLCDGTKERATSPNVDLTAATAMLLSARFPYVTPTGALVRCRQAETGNRRSRSDTEPYAVSYVVDGGYYENSGILTTLQIWLALKPLVTEYNRIAPDAPVVPWLVIADNAYRSSASEPGRRRPLELLAPLRANQNRTLLVTQQPLEQMAAVAFRASGRIDCDPTGGCRQGLPSEDRVLVISPNQEATVAAPLGWVLSQVSRDDLSRQLCHRLQTSTVAQELLARLKGTVSGSLTPLCVE